MWRHFLPAYDGYLFDDYGNSKIEESKQQLLAIRKALQGDAEQMASQKRKYPFTVREAFRTDAKTCHFNASVLQDRLDEFSFGNKFKQRGNLEWMDGVPDTEVVWKPSETGRFTISVQPPKQLANRYTMLHGKKAPYNVNRFVAGGDPFKFDVVQGNRKSDGAGAVFMFRDANADPDEKDISQWTTHRFVCTYSKRPRTKDEYTEDMIKMCVYYGCYMFPEINVPTLWEGFVNRGYGGYLLYRKDPGTGRVSKTPGANTSTGVQDEIFKEYYTYIELHGAREVHDELLEQCLAVDDKMTDYDLFVAGGMALVAAKRDFRQVEERSIDIKKYHKIFKYG